MTASFILRRLALWTAAAGVTALPSAIILGKHLDHLIPGTAGWLGVGAVVAAFGAVLGAASCLIAPLRDERSLPARALTAAVKIRAFLSVLCTLGVMSPALMFTPDFWCGWGALIVRGSLFGPETSPLPLAAICFTVAVEGLLLLVLLAVVAFFALIVIQIRERKRASREMVAAASCPPAVP